MLRFGFFPTRKLMMFFKLAYLNTINRVGHLPSPGGSYSSRPSPVAQMWNVGEGYFWVSCPEIFRALLCSYFSCNGQEGLAPHQQITGKSGESGKKHDIALILHAWCWQPLRSYLRVVTDNFSAWFKANSCWFDCLAAKNWWMTLKMNNYHKSPHSNSPRKKLKNNGFRDICCTP